MDGSDINSAYIRICLSLYIAILFIPSMWSSTLESPYLLLSYPIVSIASHIFIILISSL